MTAPQYGQQPYYEPPEGIAITTQFSAFFTPFFGAVRPKVLVNGDEIPVWGWGRTVLPRAPGQYNVHVHVPYVFPKRAGRADYTTAVPPGQLVELEYRAPFFSFSRGSLGPPPQRYGGVGAVIALLTICVVFIAIMLIAAA
jgi:hypothetical protein